MEKLVTELARRAPIIVIGLVTLSIAAIGGIPLSNPPLQIGLFWQGIFGIVGVALIAVGLAVAIKESRDTQPSQAKSSSAISAIFPDRQGCWVRVSKDNLPKECDAAGSESDGTPLYIARARYENGIHIGKTRKEFGGALIPWDGKEITVGFYEVYIGSQKWIAAKNGEVPMGALFAGKEADGNPLYIARADFMGGLHIGKVNPRFGAALIPYGGKEHSVKQYEVLVID
jgi:hypothetical protein